MPVGDTFDGMHGDEECLLEDTETNGLILLKYIHFTVTAVILFQITHTYISSLIDSPNHSQILQCTGNQLLKSHTNVHFEGPHTMLSKYHM